jgi:hypothetical protein
MPGHIAGHSAVFVEHDESACALKTGRTDRGALAPRAELVKWALTAGQERDIAGSLRSKNHGHDSADQADQDLTWAHHFSRYRYGGRLMGSPESDSR